MCLWCEVEQRVYRSYEHQERRALAEIEKLRQERPVGPEESEECPDSPRCVWEKKLEFVMARVQKERLATEMAASDRCGFPERENFRREATRIPAPTIPPHLLLAFERYIETMFDRLTREKKPARRSPRRSRSLLRFDPSRETNR